MDRRVVDSLEAECLHKIAAAGEHGLTGKAMRHMPCFVRLGGERVGQLLELLALAGVVERPDANTAGVVRGATYKHQERSRSRVPSVRWLGGDAGGVVGSTRFAAFVAGGDGQQARSAGRPAKYPLHDLLLGESFFVAGDPASVRAAASVTGKKLGRRFRCFKTEEEGQAGVRCQRIK